MPFLLFSLDSISGFITNFHSRRAIMLLNAPVGGSTLQYGVRLGIVVPSTNCCN